MTSITRVNDEFTTRNRANGVTITVKGTVGRGKVRVSAVTIESDGQTTTYDSVDKVPADVYNRFPPQNEVSHEHRE